MTYNEVMINDWVLDASTGEPVRFNIPDFITNPTRLICNCKPILLTAEILEENGFTDTREINDDEVQSTVDFSLEFPRLGEEGFIHTYRNPHGVDCWHFEILPLKTGCWVKTAFKYVHELQQALRLCGLTDLADNFRL